MSDLVKIVQFHQAGGAEVLQIDELPLPQPGPGEVRLRVKAIGVNRADIMFREDKYFVSPVFPSKLGYEASGIVEAVGPGVDPSLIGKVRSTVPIAPYGTYGEVAIVPISALAAYPEKLSFEEGASIWMQYITAYGALVRNGRIAKGDYVVLTAAASSVGIASIQIAKSEGAVVIATIREVAKKAELLAAGADHVIVTRDGVVTDDGKNIAERILEITNGIGAKIIFDPIAGPAILELAKATAKDALVIIYGALSPEPTPFPVFESWSQGAQRKPFSMKGYVLVEITNDPEALGEAVKYIYEKLENGELKPRIDRTFSLANVVDAHRYMEKGQQIGKIVITV
jgi:NADPH:quinone reductase-like Zn-dependent oxidoreductase